MLNTTGDGYEEQKTVDYERTEYEQLLNHSSQNCRTIGIVNSVVTVAFEPSLVYYFHAESYVSCIQTISVPTALRYDHARNN